MATHLCAIAFFGLVVAASGLDLATVNEGKLNLPPCDFFKIPAGYMEASGGAAGNIACKRWPSLDDAKKECFAIRECDGFSFGPSGSTFYGCLKKNRAAGYNPNKAYAGYHKNIVGCCRDDEYKLQGDGVCAVSVEKLVSQGKTTIQSSVAYGGVPARAVDGDKNVNYHAGSCTHTARQTNPWWQVDLGQMYFVTKVAITNRGDCCFERLSNFEIRIGKYMASSGNTACVEHAELGKGETRAFQCDSLGRHVNVKIIGQQYLTLCEVQVFALVPVGNGGDFVEKSFFLSQGSSIGVRSWG